MRMIYKWKLPLSKKSIVEVKISIKAFYKSSRGSDLRVQVFFRPLLQRWKIKADTIRLSAQLIGLVSS